MIVAYRSIINYNMSIPKLKPAVLRSLSIMDKIQGMTNVPSKFITRLLRRVYFAAFAALPLSSIHIDAVRGTHVLIAGRAHQEHNVLLLHRIFSLHFDSRSDHCSTSDQDGLCGAVSR